MVREDDDCGYINFILYQDCEIVGYIWKENMQEIKIKLQHPDVKVPTYATDGAGCFDIYADLPPSCISCRVTADTPTEIETDYLLRFRKVKALLVFSRMGRLQERCTSS